MKKIIIFCILFILSIVIIIKIIKKILKSPFNYPYFNKSFDVSGKKNSDLIDLIDAFLIDGGFFGIQRQHETIEKWKAACNVKIEKCILKKYRMKQFQQCIDDYRAFVFYLERKQTRYQQRNYVKTSYYVYQTIDKRHFDYEWLCERNEMLKKINFECTIKAYHNKNQRNLLTNDLKRKIKIRDNYTCQICGKYMPDEVGLHIDHIIPISKGGKSIPSNLQVLCSKCNGHKSNKY